MQTQVLFEHPLNEKNAYMAALGVLIQQLTVGTHR